MLLRLTLGVEADTHEAIRTGHHGSKFGLPPDDALALLRRALELGLDAAGLHVHVGSQLADEGAHHETIRLLGAFAARCRDELGWTASVVDAGGGFPVRQVPDEPWAPLGELAAAVAAAVRAVWSEQELPEPRIVLEPGRALVGRAGVTLYRVGAVKRLPGLTWVAIDGGMSDNPRRQLYGARYTAMLADRAKERPSTTVSVAGLALRVRGRPDRRRGAPRAACAATCSRCRRRARTRWRWRRTTTACRGPPRCSWRDGAARLIRRRETIDDLLALETG